jgi:hypothetical protein
VNGLDGGVSGGWFKPDSSLIKAAVVTNSFQTAAKGSYVQIPFSAHILLQSIRLLSSKSSLYLSPPNKFGIDTMKSSFMEALLVRALHKRS